LSFFKISVKTIVFVVIYLMLVYTVCYGFTGARSGQDYVVVMSDIPMSRTNITVDINATIIEGSGNLWGLIGAVAGFIVAGVATVLSLGALSGVTVPVMITLGSGIAGAGAGYFIGGAIGRGVTQGMLDADIEVPWQDLSLAVTAFFGSIIDLFLFMVSFLTFGLIGDAFIGFPSELVWIPFLMALPVYLYFMIIVAGFAVEVWKGSKKII